MQVLSGYRPRNLMTLAQAQRFEKMIAANGRFTDVQIRESGRTQSPERRWYVYYTPRSVERAKQLLADAQAQRDERAKQGEYEFQLSECGRFHHCHSLKSGKWYETTHAHCTCGDYQFRLRRTGLRCCHSAALELWLDQEATHGHLRPQ